MTIDTAVLLADANPILIPLIRWVTAAPVAPTQLSIPDEAFGQLAVLAGVAEDEIRIALANMVPLTPTNA